MTDARQPSDDLKMALDRLLPVIPDLVRMVAHRTFWTEADFNDVVQEIGLAATLSLHRVSECGEGDRLLRAYLMGIVRHKVQDRDEMNAKARCGIRHDIIAQATEENLAAEVNMAEGQLDQQLQECLFQLTEDGRALLHLRYVNRMTLEAIAGHLRIHTGTAVRRHKQLLRDLRNCLGSSGAYHFAMRYQS